MVSACDRLLHKKTVLIFLQGSIDYLLVLFVPKAVLLSHISWPHICSEEGAIIPAVPLASWSSKLSWDVLLFLMPFVLSHRLG